MKLFYRLPLGLLSCIFVIASTLHAQFTFPVEAGPFLVAPSSTTVCFNDAANMAGIPSGQYISFELTADWAVDSGNPWSSEADITLETSLTTAVVNTPTSGAMMNGDNTTLGFTDFLDIPYDPDMDGELCVILDQSFPNTVASWSNLTLSLTLASSTPPTTVAGFGISGCGDSDGIDSFFDTDLRPANWIAVTLNEDVLSTTFDTEGSALSDTEIAVYDDSGTLLGTDDDGGTGSLSSLTLTNLTAGVYYVAVTVFNAQFFPFYNVTVDRDAEGSVSLNVTNNVVPGPGCEFGGLVGGCSTDDPLVGIGGGSYADGVFSGPGVTDDGNFTTFTFDPAAAGAGIHVITYSGTGEPDVTTTIEVLEGTPLNFNALADVCIGTGEQTGLNGVTLLSGPMVGFGAFSGTGVTDNGSTYDFDPAAAGLGTFDITFVYTNMNFCVTSATDQVEVFALAGVALAALDDLCLDAGVQTNVMGGTPAQGTVAGDMGVYSGPGVTDDGNGTSYTFDPGTAGAGTHTITYTYSDNTGCTGTATDEVVVLAGPSVNLNTVNIVCQNDGVQTGVGGGTPTGGVYSGTGVTDDGNGTTYSFDPATTGLGTTTVTYSFTDGNGCTNVATDDIEVVAEPTVNFSALAGICEDVEEQFGLGGGTPVGGVYSGPGVVDNGNGTTFTLSTADAGVGTSTITYTFCVENAVFDNRTINFNTGFPSDAAVPIFEAENFTATSDISNLTITWKGLYDTNTPPATDDFTIVFYSNNGGLPNNILQSFSVGNAVNRNNSGEFTNVFSYSTDIVFNLAAGTDYWISIYNNSTNSNEPWFWVIDESIGGSASSSNQVNWQAFPGEYFVFISETGMLCCAEATSDIEIFATPTVTFTAPDDLCIDAGEQTGLSGGLPAQGTATGDLGVYSGTGVTDDGNGMTYSFDPITAGVGVHTITYTYTDGNGCTATASDDIEVAALPTPTLTAFGTVCDNEGIQTGLGGGLPTGGIYSGPGVTDDRNGLTYTFDPVAAGLGPHTISYTAASVINTDNYDNLPAGPNGVFIASDRDVSVFIAEDFVAPRTGNVTTINWTGAYRNAPDGAPTDNFRVRIYADNAGSVGSLLYDETVSETTTVTRTLIGTISGVDWYSYSTNIIFPATEGTTYWLSIFNSTIGQDGEWFWSLLFNTGGTSTVIIDNFISFDVAPFEFTATADFDLIVEDRSCEATVMDDVTVLESTPATLTVPTAFCEDAGVQTNLSGGAPTQGTVTGDIGMYSGPGVTDNNNGLSYNFDPAAAGVGIHTITYTYTNGDGCVETASDQVRVLGTQDLSFTALDDLCVNAGLQTGLGSGAPTGGVYSGPGVTDDGNGMTYTFNPSSIGGSGVGVHTITYSVPNTYTLDNEFDAALINPNFNGSNADASVLDYTAARFIPAASGDLSAVSWTGFYSRDDGVPSATDDFVISVYANDAGSPGALLYTEAVGNTVNRALEGTQIPLGQDVYIYTASVDFFVDQNTTYWLAIYNNTPGDDDIWFWRASEMADVNAAFSSNDLSTWTSIDFIFLDFSLEIEDTDVCGPATATDEVEVFRIPVFDIFRPQTFCEDDPITTVSNIVLPRLFPGVYSGPGVTDNGDGDSFELDIPALGPGVFTVTYTETNGACSNSANVDMTILSGPAVSFADLDDLCEDEGVQTGLSGGTPVQGTVTGDPGVYSGAGVTDDGNGMTFSFDPTVAGVGIHTITYMYTDENSCTGTATTDIEVANFPTPTFTAFGTVCDNEGIQTGLGGGLPTGGIYSGPGVTDDRNGLTYTFDPVAAGLGSHTISYTASSVINTSIFDNLPTGPDDALIASDRDGPVYLADDFVAPRTGNVTTINWTGVYQTFPNVALTDDFSVNIYADNAGSIGSLLYTENVSMVTTVTRTLIGTLQGVELYSYSTNIIFPVTEGTTYWLSVYNNTINQDGTWLWALMDNVGGPIMVANALSFSNSSDVTATLDFDLTVEDRSCDNTTTDEVTVLASTPAALTVPSAFCVDDGVQTNLSGGTPVQGTANGDMGVYSGPGVADNGDGLTYDFDPAAAGVGIHTITYTYTNENGCVETASDELRVLGKVDVTFTAVDDLCVDAGIQTGLGGGLPTGGIYSGPGVTDDGDGLTYSFDPSSGVGAGVGTHVITYSVSNSYTVNSSFDTNSDEINGRLSDVQRPFYVTGRFIPIASGDVTEVNWTGFYARDNLVPTTDNFIISIYSDATGAPGTLLYTEAVGNAVNRALEGSQIVTNNLDVYTYNATINFSLTQNTTYWLVIYNNTTGTTDEWFWRTSPNLGDAIELYESNDLSNWNNLDEEVLDFSLEIGDTDVCGPSTATDEVEVFEPLTIIFTALDDLCEGAGVQTGLGSALPTGGVYSGPGVTDDGNGETYSFDPAAAGAGTQTITYTFPFGETTLNNGVTLSSSSTGNASDVDFPNYVADDFTPFSDGSITSVSWSGLYATDDTPPAADDFTISIFSDNNGVGTQLYSENVGTAVNRVFSGVVQNGPEGDVDLYNYTAAVDFAVLAGTTYWISIYNTTTGEADNWFWIRGDAGNGEESNDLSAWALVGFEYDFSLVIAENACSPAVATDVVEVFPLPFVAIEVSGTFCEGDPINTDVDVNAIPSGGVFSGSGVIDNGNGMNFNFDPSSSGAGTIIVTYTFTNANGCSNSATGSLTVLPAPSVSFTAPNDVFIDAGVQTGLSGGTPAEGTVTSDFGIYSGPGVTDDGNGMTYSFDPMAAGVGTQIITYTYRDENGCTSSASDEVEVTSTTFTAPDDVCENEGVLLNQSGGLPPGGTYSGPGVIDNGDGTYDFDPAAAGVGIQTITYTNGEVVTDEIEVFALPDVTLEIFADGYCLTPTGTSALPPPPALGLPIGGVFSGSNITDDGNGQTYSLDASALTAGDIITLTYTFTDANGCSNSASDDFEVFDFPDVSLTALDDLCIDAGEQVNLTGGIPANTLLQQQLPEFATSGGGSISDGTDSDETIALANAASFNLLVPPTPPQTTVNGITLSVSLDHTNVGDLTITLAAPDGTLLPLMTRPGRGESGTGNDDDVVAANGPLNFSDNFTTSAEDIGDNTATTVGSDGVFNFAPAADFLTVTDASGPIISTFSELFSSTDLDGLWTLYINDSNTGNTGDLVSASIIIEYLEPAGRYIGNGVTLNDDGTYNFDPAVVGVGVHTITYFYNDENGCSDSATDEVEVFDLPDVGIELAGTFCANDPAQVVTPDFLDPAGGVFSGLGVTDSGNGADFIFDPTVAGAGNITITYTFTDNNGCSNSETGTLVVNDLPTISFTAPADLCLNDPEIVGVGGGLPTGGTYSGDGVTDAGNGTSFSFDPAIAGVGTTTITYSFTDGNGCTNTATDDIEVFALPSVAFTAPDDLCLNDGIQMDLGGGTPTGGVYSGVGVTDDGNGMTYSFDPSIAGISVQTITYTVGVAGCDGSASDQVEVFGPPDVGLEITGDFCANDAAQVITPDFIDPTGGIFSGAGVTDTGNGADFTFDPATAGVGNITVIYTFTDNNGCSSSETGTLAVNDLPTVSFTAPFELCLNDPALVNADGGTPTGGVYSGDGVTDDGNGMTFSFDPAVAGVGTTTITYTFTDGNNCTNIATDDIEVFEPPTVTFTALPDLCIDAGEQLNLAGGSPTGGTYSGPGVTDNRDDTYNFNPTVAGSGMHTITYTFIDGNECENSASDVVEVFDLPDVNFQLDLPIGICTNDPVTTITPSSVVPAIGGVFSGVGVTDNGDGQTFDLEPASLVGTTVVEVFFTFTDANGCTNFTNSSRALFQAPTVTFTAPPDQCVDAGVSAALGGGSPAGGIYSGPGVTDNGNGTTYSFDPAAAGVGTHDITYTFTDGNSCTVSTTDDVEVFALPTVTFTALTDLCIDAGVQSDLSNGVPMGGTYSGPGVTDNGNDTYDFDPVAAGVGSHIITYAFMDTNGCSGSATDVVEVFDLPTVTFTAPEDLCSGATPLTGLSGGTPLGGTYSGPGVTDNGDDTYDFDPSVAGIGTFIITYTFTSTDGCTSSASDMIEILGCEITISDPCACLDNATIIDLDAGTGGDDGQFSERVSITGANGGPLPTGQIWTVVSANGATDAFSVPVIGIQSAGVPLATDGSLQLSFLMDAYIIDFVHVDAIGYTIEIEGPYALNDPRNVTRIISNNCQYPNPVFDPTLPSSIDNDDPAITLGGTDTNGNAVDNVSFTVDGSPAASFDPSMLSAGDHTVVMTFDGAADNNMNVSPDGGMTPAAPGCVQTVQQVIEVIICDPPTAICQNITAQLDDMGNASITAADVDGGSIAECGLASLTIDITDFTCVNIGTNDVILTITDTNGDSDNCTAVVTVEDNIPPVALCQNIMVQLDDTGNGSTTPADVDDGSDDACGIASLTLNIMDFDCDDIGDNPVVLTVTDVNGNVSTDNCIVTVEDNIPPVALCQDITVQVSAATATATVAPTDIDNGSNDACGIANLALDITEFTCEDEGDNPVVLTVTDVNGNTSTCDAIVTIEDDNVPFEFGCVGDLNVTLRDDCSAVITPEMVITGAFLPCVEEAIVTVDGGTTDVMEGCGLHTYTVELIEDGVSIYTCWGNVFAEDKTAPTLTCPTAISGTTTPLGDSDFICTDVDELLFFGPQTYEVTRTGTIISATLSTAVKDILDITGYPTVGDNCTNVLVTITDVLIDGGDCNADIIERTFTVTDNADGQDCSANDPDAVNPAVSCTQIITIRKPTFGDLILPPAVVEIACVDAPASGANPTPDDIGPGGYPTIFTAFDANPNVAGFQGYALGLTNSDTAPGTGDVVFDSYCNIGLDYEDGPRIQVCEGSYRFIRTWTVLDWCETGSPITYQQTIKVGDFGAPTIDAPATISVSAAPNSCLANINIPSFPVSDSDGCSSATLTSWTVLADGTTFFAGGLFGDSTADFVQAPIGDHLLEICATDDCDNTDCVLINVIVRDEIEPTAVCDDQLNVSIGGGDVANGIEGIARIFATDVDEGSNDNCSDVVLAVRRNFWSDNTCNNSPDAYSSWGEFVDFYCCDINQNIELQLRATDASGNENICWLVVTPEDKINPTCFAPANQELTCAELPLTFPGDLEQAYEDDYVGTSLMMNALFGAATGTDNCAVDTIVEISAQVNLNECGWGSISRRFEVWQVRPEGDVNGNDQIDRNEAFVSLSTCRQTITVTEVHDFVIDFPEDADAECGDPTVPSIETNTEGCDVLSINIGDPVRFQATGDECYKYYITYDVINWCLWDGEYTGFVIDRMTEDDGEDLAVDRAVEGNERPIVRYNNNDGLCIDRSHTDRNGDSSLAQCESPDLGNYGRYLYTQFVKVYDTTAPEIMVGAYGGATENCPNLVTGQFGDDDGDCQEEVTIPFTGTDICGSDVLVDPSVDLTLISAELDLFAVDANDDGVIKANEFVAEPGDEGDVLDLIIDNGDGTYLFTGTFPIITSVIGDNILHAVRVLVEDGCGNQSSVIFEFDVIDCKGPAPICINGLTVTLMPNPSGEGCEMAIWASDFEGSPIYDCTGQGPDTNASGDPRVTQYAIYRATTVENDPNFVPSPDDTGLILNQDDEETTIVYVYAFDEEGNYDFCETYILVQAHDNCNDPNGSGTISGIILTEDARAVENVEVNLSGDMAMGMTTNATGTYTFDNLTVGGDYTLTPYLNADPLNGVTTFDIIKITQHILAVQPLDGPYKRIAADANRSGTVSTLDLIQIRKLILNVITEFPNNTSWRFVEAGYSFPDVTDPWVEAFPELVSINNLPAQITAANFVAIKVGDVNDSAIANSLQGDDRTMNGWFELEVEDIAMKAGNTYTVAVRASEIVAGFQGTLNLQGAQFIDIIEGVMKVENFGLRYVEQGQVTMSYHCTGGDALQRVLAAREEVLFSLVIRAEEDRWLSEVLSIGSRYTRAEAYAPSVAARQLPGGEQIWGVGIRFGGQQAARVDFALYQNVPNPFVDETMIGFELPEGVAEEATLMIRDAAGRLVMTLKTDVTAGYNSVTITADQLTASGVLTYTITAGEYTATKKMVTL